MVTASAFAGVRARYPQVMLHGFLVTVLSFVLVLIVGIFTVKAVKPFGLVCSTLFLGAWLLGGCAPAVQAAQTAPAVYDAPYSAVFYGCTGGPSLPTPALRPTIQAVSTGIGAARPTTVARYGK